MKLNKKWAFCICDFETTGISEDSLPIEVGCIWTDSNFRTITTYEAMVGWPLILDRDHMNWWPQEMGAFGVHKISWEEYMKKAKPVGEVAFDIHFKTCEIRTKYDRVILISDNAKFETNHMKKIMEQHVGDTFSKWPFHYCTWDTSLALEATGVGDPEPIHRALPDAALLQVAIIQFMERVRNIS